MISARGILATSSSHLSSSKEAPAISERLRSTEESPFMRRSIFSWLLSVLRSMKSFCIISSRREPASMPKPEYVLGKVPFQSLRERYVTSSKPVISSPHAFTSVA